MTFTGGESRKREMNLVQLERLHFEQAFICDDQSHFFRHIFKVNSSQPAFCAISIMAPITSSLVVFVVLPIFVVPLILQKTGLLSIDLTVHSLKWMERSSFLVRLAIFVLSRGIQQVQLAFQFHNSTSDSCLALSS